MSAEIFQQLENYKNIIEKRIEEDLSINFGPKTALKDACEYALLNGGKRFRPAIVLMTAKALGNGLNVSDAALAVEYFHTASLIADDLPSMDNDDFRRNKPSTHKVFGEGVALLASYALISAGYRAIYQNAALYPNNGETLCLEALKCATRNTGILGATGGQFLDLYPPDHSLETVKNVLDKKTVTLFEIAFTLGWLFGGGDLTKLDTIKKLSYHFGMAFQIADDFSDVSQDDLIQKEVNLVTSIGVKESAKIFQIEIDALKETLKTLSLDSAEFLGMVAILEKNALDQIRNLAT